LNPIGQQQKKPSWKVHAYFLDACNCDWGCPCQFNANPTHGNCEGVTGYHIITGIYGTKVKLDGLNMALIASWPGPLHEGRGKASYYIDNRAGQMKDSLRPYQTLLQVGQKEDLSLCMQAI
jgi:hypothetical protein